jgi:hypothetical protein
MREIPAHLEESPGQVHIVPLEREEFPLAESCAGGTKEERIEGRGLFGRSR